jgi:hypothetical protein
MSNKWKIWIARALIGVVLIINLDAAFSFLFSPGDFAPAFELSGQPGIAMIRGVGLLFLMWNVPYVIALINPIQFSIALLSAVVMQAIGVIGETFILLSVTGSHPQITASTTRFIIFDAGGLVVLLLAGWIVIQSQKRNSTLLSK